MLFGTSSRVSTWEKYASSFDARHVASRESQAIVRAMFGKAQIEPYRAVWWNRVGLNSRRCHFRRLRAPQGGLDRLEDLTWAYSRSIVRNMFGNAQY
jgi:hypothetical protein